jgi:hypothetical protein
MRAEVSLPDGVVRMLSDSEVCSLCWRAIDWSVLHHAGGDAAVESIARRKSRTRYYREHVIAAEKTLKLKFNGTDDRRLNNLIERGASHLRDSELAFMKVALNELWLRGATAGVIHKLVKHAGEDASPGMSTKMYARLLGLRTEKNSQAPLKPFVGEHFLLRGTYSDPALLVSYMKIDQDPDAKLPAQFVTQSWITDGPSDSDERVEGVYYSPEDENEGVIFSIGRYLNSTHVRSAIFTPVRKPSDTSDDEMPLDLRGIRLGLRLSSREPQGYRIWCSRLMGKAPEEGWGEHARSYPISKGVPPRLADDSAQRWFEKHVVGFKHIMAWLSVPSARLD